MRILIYGSTYLTEICCYALMQAGHELIGYVPNENEPTVPGRMPIPRADNLHDCNMILSIQYDRKIEPTIPLACNLHTGLLPEWGGCDILYHTLREGAPEQGMTFHVMTGRIDVGPIISKITYPVLTTDTVLDLYERVAVLAPGFVVLAVGLIERMGFNVWRCPYVNKVDMYRRGNIDPEDRAGYDQMLPYLRAMVERRRQNG